MLMGLRLDFRSRNAWIVLTETEFDNLKLFKDFLSFRRDFNSLKILLHLGSFLSNVLAEADSMVLLYESRSDSSLKLSLSLPEKP